MSNWIDNIKKTNPKKHTHFMVRFDDETQNWLIKKAKELEVSCNKIIIAIIKQEAIKDKVGKRDE